MHTRIHPIVIAGLLNLVVFTIFYIFINATYNSSEDVYVLYLLGGGYGKAPTEMLHFDYGLHPLLGYCIKSLFQVTNKINWYSLALIFAHYLSFTIILSCVIPSKNRRLAYAVYTALFLVFEGYFLLYPDFTASSLVVTMTALVLLLTESWKGQLSYRVCITAGVLLVLASFYRVHTILPLAGIALPFLVFTLSKKLLMRSLAVLLVSAICVFTFNWMHEAYYKSKKADWPKEEAYRQKIFRIVNGAGSLKIPRPGEKWYYEYQLATRGIIMDTAYLPSVSLDSAYYQLRESRTSSPKISRDWKKWFWINNRLFFFLTLFIVLLFGLHKKILPATLTAIVLIIAGFGYLILKAKAPPYLLISALSFFSFTIFLHGKDQFITTKKNYGVIALVIALLFTAWGAVRLYRTSNMNLGVIKQFKDQYAEMAAHPDKLFIHIRGFYSHRFAVMDPPSRFPLTNYLHAEHFTSNIYQETLQTYHIHNTREIFSSPDVLFWGKPTDEAMAYFEKVAGRPLVLEGPLNEFKTGSVWKVK